MKDLGLINIHNLSDTEGAKLQKRQAVRAVIFDTENNVALVHVTKNQYYKLPGGGIEPGEDHVTTLRRECHEEIGCDVEIIREIGQIREYRDLNQTSYCYLAKLKGEKGTPDFTELEQSEGHEHLWVPLEEAITLVEQADPHDNNGIFIRVRDTLLLKKARMILQAG